MQLRRILTLALPLVLLTTACGGDDDDTATTTTEVEETTTTAESTTSTSEVDSITEALGQEHMSVVAKAEADQIAVRDDASASATITMTLPKFDPDYSGEDGEQFEQVFLVEDYRDGWLQVLLPVRPNGTTGWINLADVEVSKHDYRVVVELAAHKMKTTKGGEVIQEADIAVGTNDTPTPGGKFFLNALLKPPDPDTIYGTYAYALSGYSDTLRSFAGGDGVIGIHGTNDPSVMGSDVSHGCIRLRNEDIEALVEQLPLGTPVEIQA